MEKILITGATGQLGKEVVNLLLKKVDAQNLSILVRDFAKAEDFKSKGVTVRKGDYMDYESLVKAFKGIDKLYFISTNDFSNREKQHENVVNAAVEAKVKHIVYTSFQRKDETELSPIRMLTAVHIFTEKIIKASGLPYTILRHGLYADFIPIMLGEKVFETGSIYLPADNGKASFTLRSDLAKGAVEILTTNGHENKIYEFCAPKSYSFNDITEILSKINGKVISYVSPNPNDYKNTLSQTGVPEVFINLFAGCAQGIKQGEFDFQDNTLTKTLKHDCFDLKKFLTDVYKK